MIWPRRPPARRFSQSSARLIACGRVVRSSWVWSRSVGAIQVPADGQPLVFLADHPTTGGYPVIAVVERGDLPLLAQARPGTAIRFLPWT